MLLPHIQNVAALGLCDAAGHVRADRVMSLLASGVDPNARFDDLPSPFSGVAGDWASAEKSTHPPATYDDDTVLPALCRASEGVRLEHRPAQLKIMTALLQHGADPYMLFRQSIFVYRSTAIFPGHVGDPEWGKEEGELLRIRCCNMQLQENALLHERRRQREESGTQDNHNWDSESDNFYDLDYIPTVPRKFGVYSIIHSLLEDGHFVRPVLDFLVEKNNLDLERRDPQGRTLFLAACRNPLGLDASIDGTFRQLVYDGILVENCYPQPNSPWRRYEHPDTKPAPGRLF